MATDGEESELRADIEVLRSACSESRLVLDHQLDVLSEIDDKAMWSVRTAVIVLGLLISAASLADGESIQSLPPRVFTLATTGTVSLVFTIWFGMVTYHWSFEEFGIGAGERAEALAGQLDERSWRIELLKSGYTAWIGRQEAFNRYNHLLLLGTHLALSIGVTLLLLAGGLYLITP